MASPPVPLGSGGVPGSAASVASLPTPAGSGAGAASGDPPAANADATAVDLMTAMLAGEALADTDDETGAGAAAQLSPAQLDVQQRIQDLERQWRLPTHVNMESFIKQRLGLSTGTTLDDGQMRDARQQLLVRVAELETMALRLGVAGDATEAQLAASRTLRGVRNVIVLSELHVRLSEGLKRCLRGVDGQVYTDVDLGRVLMPELNAGAGEEGGAPRLSPYQNFLQLLLKKMAVQQLKVQDGMMYAQVQTDAGHATHVWRRRVIQDREQDVKQWVYESSQVATGRGGNAHHDAWYMSTHSRSNARDATQYLTDCQEPTVQLPPVDREFLAFANGLYHTGDPNGGDAFYPWGEPAPPGVRAATFHNMDFPVELWDAEHPTAGETPAFDLLFETQGVPKEAMFWVYVLVGRMMHKLNQWEQWGVIPFAFGETGTGKSVILQIIEALLGEGSMGMMESDGDMKYIAAALMGSLTWATPELRRESRIPVGKLLSLVTGERTSVRAMRKEPYFVKWDIPGWLAGNQVPLNWDVPEPLKRRLVVLLFNVVPAERDLSIKDRILTEELAKLAMKCTRCYHAAIHLVGKGELKEHMHPYFTETTTFLMSIVDPVSTYLATPGSNYALAPVEVRQRYSAWAREGEPVPDATEAQVATSEGRELDASALPPRSRTGAWTGDLSRPVRAPGGPPCVVADTVMYTEQCAVPLEELRAELNAAANANKTSSVGGGGGGGGMDQQSLSRAIRAAGLTVASMNTGGAAEGGSGTAGLVVLGLMPKDKLGLCTQDAANAHIRVRAGDTVLNVRDDMRTKEQLLDAMRATEAALTAETQRQRSMPSSPQYSAAELVVDAM